MTEVTDWSYKHVYWLIIDISIILALQFSIFVSYAKWWHINWLRIICRVLYADVPQQLDVPQQNIWMICSRNN